MSTKKRIGNIASHVVSAAVESEAKPPSSQVFESPLSPAAPQHGITPDERAVHRQRLLDEPRMSKDLATWATADLIHRALAMGASDDDITACVDAPNSKALLMDIVTSLEPPSASSATVEMITVERDESVEKMVDILETVGALVIKNAIPEEEIAEIDEQLDAAGCWKISREGKGRMQMDGLLKAPACRKMLTNEYVLAVTRATLGRSCKRIALKELSIFEVQPGNPKQTFHREDQFWPWHHEPTPWTTNILWAIDDFTVENGGTNVVPYSHRSTEYMREHGREMAHADERVAHGDYTDVMKVHMPRGSVLLFTGGLMHGSGENVTQQGRKSLLSSYVLGWLRTEYKWWAHKPLHAALESGEFDDELTELMGHYDGAPGQMGGTRMEPYSEWAGGVHEGVYLSRLAEQVEEEVGLDAMKPGVRGVQGYEMSGGGNARRREEEDEDEDEESN